MFIPFNGNPAGTLEPGENFAAWIDSFIVPGRMYQETWDPEGLFSTIPAIATGISGMLCGKLITELSKTSEKIIKLFFWGTIVLIISHFWDYTFPINKHIWTSSYVLYSSGLAMIILAASMWIIDEKKYTSNIKFGLVFGSNAIVAYVLHGIVWRLFQFPIIGGVGFQKFWMDTGIGLGLSPKFVSLLPTKEKIISLIILHNSTQGIFFQASLIVANIGLSINFISAPKILAILPLSLIHI